MIPIAMRSTKGLQNLTFSVVTVPSYDWTFLPATHSLLSLRHFFSIPPPVCVLLSRLVISISRVTYYSRRGHTSCSKIDSRVWTKRWSIAGECVNPQIEGSLNRIGFASPCMVYHETGLDDRYLRERRSSGHVHCFPLVHYSKVTHLIIIRTTYSTTSFNIFTRYTRQKL